MSTVHLGYIDVDQLVDKQYCYIFSQNIKRSHLPGWSSSKFSILVEVPLKAKATTKWRFRSFY